MLAYILAIAVGLGSVALYMAAFFFPEVHRKGDFVWSGVGFFYALTLWACAGRITGAVLLGQGASVALIGWWGWQALTLRRAVAPAGLKTPVPPKVQQQLAEVFQTEPSQGSPGLKSQELSTVSIEEFQTAPLSEGLSSEVVSPEGLSSAVTEIQGISQEVNSAFSAPENTSVTDTETDTELAAAAEPREFEAEEIPDLNALTLESQPLQSQLEERLISATPEISKRQDSSSAVEFAEKPQQVRASEAELPMQPARSAPETQPKGLSKLLGSIRGLFQQKKGQPQGQRQPTSVALATSPELTEQTVVDDFGQRVQDVAETVKEKVQDAIADSKEALADLEFSELGQKVQNKVQDVAETVKEKVQDVIADSKEALADLESSELGRKVQNKVQDVAETVKEKVQDVIADSKEAFGESVQSGQSDSRMSSTVSPIEPGSENLGPESKEVILEIIQLEADPSVGPETLTISSEAEGSEAERSGPSASQSIAPQPQVVLEAPSLDDYSTELSDQPALKRPNPPTPKPKKASQKSIEKPELGSE